MASKFDRFSGWTPGVHDKCLLKINKLKEQCDSYKAEIKSLKAEVKLLKKENKLLLDEHETTVESNINIDDYIDSILHAMNKKKVKLNK